jgi:hypothetical protein
VKHATLPPAPRASCLALLRNLDVVLTNFSFILPSLRHRMRSLSSSSSSRSRDAGAVALVYSTTPDPTPTPMRLGNCREAQNGQCPLCELLGHTGQDLRWQRGAPPAAEGGRASCAKPDGYRAGQLGEAAASEWADIGPSHAGSARGEAAVGVGVVVFVWSVARCLRCAAQAQRSWVGAGSTGAASWR